MGACDGKTIFENAYGKDFVVWGKSADEVLQKKGVQPDFQSSPGSGIDFIHRTTEAGEIYFLRNERDDSVTANCRFRVTGMYPELWDASTGRITRVARHTPEEGTTSLAVGLPAHGSIFVVFHKDKREELAESRVTEQATARTEVPGPWRVDFPPGWGAPPSVVIDRLASWTESEDQGIRYFSGTAAYHNSFRLDESSRGNRVLLDLGEVRDVAEVFVNGSSAGILWTKPYQADISAFVRPGVNELKIEIVNLWVNRMTGDMLAEPENRFCKTNQSFMVAEVWPGGDEPFRLQPAGLMGPVTLSVRP